MGQIRVVVVDDHQLMLDAIRLTLEQSEDIELVGEALTGSEALPLIGRTHPDLVLLDIRMPQMDGLTCLGKIRERHPKIKVVILSGIDEPEQIQTALKHGASAFVVKHVDPRDLASALRQAMAGTVFQMLGSGESSEENAAKAAGVTESEMRVLTALARGLSNKQIATELFITEQTVKFHLTNIYRKLHVRTEPKRLATRTSTGSSSTRSSRSLKQHSGAVLASRGELDAQTRSPRTPRLHEERDLRAGFPLTLRHRVKNEQRVLADRHGDTFCFAQGGAQLLELRRIAEQDAHQLGGTPDRTSTA